MMLNYRQANAHDVKVAIAVLAKMKLKDATGKQMKYTDEPTALAYMLNAERAGKVIVVDEAYVVMFDIGRPWYSKADFLLEEIIVKIAPTDKPVSVAIDALSDLSAKFYCDAVVAGDTQIGYMVPHYHAAGFVTLGQQLIKDTPHGMAPKGDGRAGPD